MMKFNITTTIRNNKIIKTVLVNTIIVSAALVASGCSEPETAASYIAKAQGFSANNQVNESIIEYKNAIKVEPNNAAVRYMLGRLYLDQGLGNSAIKELERAKELKYDYNLVIPALARAYFISDDDNGIFALKSENVNLTSEAKNQFSLYLIVAMLRNDQLEQAKAELIETEKAVAQGFYTLLAQAYVGFAEQKLPESKELAGNAVALAPKHPEGLMLQAQISVAMGDFKLANESLETYLTVQPQSNSARLLISNSYLQAGDYVNAEKYADQILAIVKNQPFANYVKAMVRMEAKDYASASEHAELALQNNFSSPNLSLVAGASAFYLNNYEKSYAHLNGLINYLPPDHFARRMLVVSQLELGIVDNIVDTVSGVEASTDANAEFLSMLSYKLLEVGAYSEAKELVNQVGKTDSENPERNLREGVLKLMLNDPSAMDSLKQAVSLDPELVKAELALAFSAVKTGDIEQAQSIADKWQTQYPDKVEGFNLQAAIEMRQKAYEKAKKSLLKSLSVDENNSFALSQLAKVAQIENDDKQAKDYSEQAFKLFPNDVQVLRQYFDLRQDEQALEVIKNKVSENPENLTYVLLYAEALTKLSRFNDAALQLSGVKATVKTPKLFWQLKLNAYQQLNNNEQVLLTLESWRKTNPYHLEATVYLAEYYAKNRDFDRALRVINQGFEHHKDNLVLELIKIQVFLNDQNSVEADQLLQKISHKIVNKNIVQGIKGRIALIERKFNQAAELLADFYTAFPTNQNVLFYTLALKNSNKAQVAVSVLEQHLIRNKNLQVQEFLATLYIEVAQNEKAISLYQSMLVEQPQSIVVLNNLAWLKMEQGNNDQALSYIEQAFVLAPSVANVADTFSQILVKLGKNREALEKAKLAYELSKEQDIDITLNYIDILIINSRKNEASTLLNQVNTNTAAQTNKKNMLLKKL